MHFDTVGRNQPFAGFFNGVAVFNAIESCHSFNFLDFKLDSIAKELRLMGDKWIFTRWIAGGADITDSPIAAAGATVFAAVKDYL